MLTSLLHEMARRWSRRTEGNDEGETAAEYAVLVALIAVIIVASVTLLGGTVDGGTTTSPTGWRRRLSPCRRSIDAPGRR
jgi:Flp pilus assembly pilin Flp